MAKRVAIARENVPFAELVLKAADSRPIVITLESMGAAVVMSEGTSYDCVEASVVLNLMANVVRSIGITRQLKEAHDSLHPSGGEQNDDIPF